MLRQRDLSALEVWRLDQLKSENLISQCKLTPIQINSYLSPFTCAPVKNYFLGLFQGNEPVVSKPRDSEHGSLFEVDPIDLICFGEILNLTAASLPAGRAL